MLLFPSYLFPLFNLLTSNVLLNNLSYNPCTHSLTTLADGKPQSLSHRYRRYQITFHRYIISRHNHLYSFRQLHYSRNIRCPEIKLRTVAIEKRRMTTTLLLGQYIYLSLKLSVRSYTPGLGQYHPALHILLLGTTQQHPKIVPGLSLIQYLAEHLYPSHNTLLRRTYPNYLYLISHWLYAGPSPASNFCPPA